MNYRPEIDGLRTLAVIPVILFHLGLEWLPGGFLGVDVFFVISGYLITAILLKDLNEGCFSLKEFYSRRIRRILPALLGVVIATLITAYFFCFGLDVPPIGWQSASALVSLANVYFWRSSGNYWGAEAEGSPLLHTWSLSVEEQFYFLFPFALWLLFRFSVQRKLLFVSLLVLLSFATFWVGTSRFPTSTFYLLPTRAWEIGVGSILAFVATKCPQEKSWSLTREFGGLVGIGLILAGYLAASGLGLGALSVVVGTSLIIQYGSTGLIKRFFPFPCLSSLGKYHIPCICGTGQFWSSNDILNFNHRL